MKQAGNEITFISTGGIMKDFSRNVTLLCPLCGNDQFESMDVEFDDIMDAPEEIKLRCSDCGSEYTRDELLLENAEVLDNAIEELEDEVVKEVERELEKALKKWKC